MCGIYGYFDRRGKSLPIEALEKMACSMRHRGPDDHGRFEGPNFAIGNQRLSIIDLDGGHQPFVSDDGQIGIVQNGEIYNYVELAAELRSRGIECRTHSDTEVLLRLYELEGMDFPKRLNGMFAIAISDRRDGSLRLIRDRIGVKPLFVFDDGERVLFGSEIKAILAAGVQRRIDLEAMHHMLTYNYVPPPRTMFAGISHLLPGHWMRVDRTGTRAERWWALEDRQVETRPEAEWAESFRELLDDSVRLRMRADVPYGAFLSGGLDSSSVVAAMSKIEGHPVKTFCIGFTDPAFDESPFAADAASRFGTDHTMERVDPNMIDMWPAAVFHCDQPHGDASFMPMLRLSQLAVRHVKMVLTGDGGDEMFGGYEKYADFFARNPSRDADDPTFRRAYHEHISIFSEHAKRSLYSPQTASSLAGCDTFQVSDAIFERAKHMDRVNQALYLDASLLLPGNNLVKPDRMPMAVSLEARDPFLDPRLMDLAFSMPGSLKVANGRTRVLYKAAVEPILGPELTHRKKTMFTVPIGEWFKRELKTFTEEILLGERSADRGLFDQSAVAGMLNSHQSGNENFTREIRALIVVELWHRIFLDASFDSAPSFQDLAIELGAAVRA